MTLHGAVFYRGEAEYLGGTVPFVLDGLAAGEPVAVAVPTANLAVLGRALGPDRDRVLLLDMAEVGRNPGRIIAGVLRAFADRHAGRRVRIIGEPVWPRRSAEEYPACVQHEALINRSFEDRDVSILCPYDRAGLDPAALSDARRTHPSLVGPEGRQASPTYAPEAVFAEYNRALPPIPAATGLSADAAGLAAVRGAVRDAAEAFGLSPQRCEDAVLVVNELATNSVEHGGGVAHIALGVADSRLVCQVADAGRLVDSLAGRRPSVAGQLRGRGLLLVNDLADLVRTHTAASGTSIRVWFGPRPAAL